MELPKPLLGVMESSLDAKGRVLLPRAYRERLGPNLSIVGLHGPALGLWNSMDLNDALASQSRRPGEPVPIPDQALCDAQGRLLLPKLMRDFARLQDRVILVGKGRMLEIWDPTFYWQLIHSNE